MEDAYQRGDQRVARKLAREISAPAGPDHAADDATARESAEALLRRTQPDAFLLMVGTLGLGLTAWLVYNYVL